MTHKMAAAVAPPPATEPHKSEEIQKDSNQVDVGRNKAKTEEFGYVVTNQR